MNLRPSITQVGAPADKDIASRVNTRRNMKLADIFDALKKRVETEIEGYKEMAADVWWLDAKGWGDKVIGLLGKDMFDILIAVAENKLIPELAYKTQHFSTYIAHKLITLHPTVQREVVDKGLPVVNTKTGKCERVDVSKVDNRQAQLAIAESRIVPEKQQEQLFRRQTEPVKITAKPKPKYVIQGNGYVLIGGLLFDQRELETILTELVNCKASPKRKSA